MSGIIESMYTGASAMNAHSWGMAVTAHNVANVNTAGFAPQRAASATGPGARGVRLDAVLRDADAPEPSDAAMNSDPSMPPEFVNPSGTDLGREMTRMISTQRSYEANARTVRSADDMLGILLDMKG